MYSIFRTNIATGDNDDYDFPFVICCTAVWTLAKKNQRKVPYNDILCVFRPKAGSQLN